MLNITDKIMSLLRKAIPVGAVILGASFGGGFVFAKQRSFAKSELIIDQPEHGVLTGENDSIPVLHRDDLQLKFVQIFFRHGARTPFKCIPNIEKVGIIFLVACTSTEEIFLKDHIFLLTV